MMQPTDTPHNVSMKLGGNGNPNSDMRTELSPETRGFLKFGRDSLNYFRENVTQPTPYCSVLCFCCV